MRRHLLWASLIGVLVTYLSGCEGGSNGYEHLLEFDVKEWKKAAEVDVGGCTSSAWQDRIDSAPLRRFYRRPYAPPK